MKTANNHHKVSTVTNNQQETSKNHPDIIKNCQKLPKIAKNAEKNAKNDQKPEKLSIVTGNTHQYHFQSICTTFAEFAMEKSVKINFALYLGNIHFSW